MCDQATHPQILAGSLPLVVLMTSPLVQLAPQSLSLPRPLHLVLERTVEVGVVCMSQAWGGGGRRREGGGGEIRTSKRKAGRWAYRIYRQAKVCFLLWFSQKIYQLVDSCC